MYVHIYIFFEEHEWAVGRRCRVRYHTVGYLTIVMLTSHWMACFFSLTQSIEDVPGSWMHHAYPDVWLYPTHNPDSV